MLVNAARLSASIALLLSMSTSALAQDAGSHLQPTSDQFGMQAGFRLSVPLGANAGERFESRAKFQLTVSATRAREFTNSNVRSLRSQDMLAIGFDQLLQPRLSINGQDLSYLAFPNVYANNEDLDVETVETATGSSRSTGFIVLGGIVLVGGGLYVAGKEFEDDISDSFRCVFSGIIGPEECKT